jgi:hypothetical protein
MSLLSGVLLELAARKVMAGLRLMAELEDGG